MLELLELVHQVVDQAHILELVKPQELPLDVELEYRFVRRLHHGAGLEQQTAYFVELHPIRPLQLLRRLARAMDHLLVLLLVLAAVVQGVVPSQVDGHFVDDGNRLRLLALLAVALVGLEAVLELLELVHQVVDHALSRGRGRRLVLLLLLERRVRLVVVDGPVQHVEQGQRLSAGAVVVPLPLQLFYQRFGHLLALALEEEHERVLAVQLGDHVAQVA